MTEHELRVCYETVYRMIASERDSRAKAASGGHAVEWVAVAECDQAIMALVVMKDELRRHVTGPIQERLIDVPEAKRPVGGY